MRYFLVSQKFNKLSINKSKIKKKNQKPKKKTESSITIQVIILYIYLLVYNWINFFKYFILFLILKCYFLYF